MFRSSLVGEVKVVLFTSKRGCQYCGQTRQLLEEIASIDGRVKLHELDKDEEKAMAEEMAVDMAPTTVVVASNGARLHYVGMPGSTTRRSSIRPTSRPCPSRSSFRP